MASANNDLHLFYDLPLFVRVCFRLLQRYFVSFTLLSARGSSAMGRFPRRPDLLLLQLSQGFSFPTEDALVYPLLDRVVRHILSWVLTPLCLSLVTPPAPKVGEGA